MHRRTVSLLLAAVLVPGLLAGCGAAQRPEPTAPAPTAPAPTASAPLTVSTGLPGDPLTVLADADPSTRALAMSRALFRRAQLVVTADAGDLNAQLLAASAAVALGAPLLLTSADASVSAAVATELDRLGATHVLSIAGGAGGARETAEPGATRTLLVAPATPAALAALLPGSHGGAVTVTASAALAAVAGLDPRKPALLHAAEPAASPRTPTPAATPTATPSPAPAAPAAPPPTLPAIERAAALSAGSVLATDDPSQLAPVATARAAGLAVHLVPVVDPNPQASAALVRALATEHPSAVIALGAPFAHEPALDWKVRSALTGTQLPGGGQVLFPDHLYVALYGTPGAPVLGVLGEQGLTASLARARAVAAPYETLTDRTVVPMFEIIASVAAGAAGPDGDYSNEKSVDELRPWVEAAGKAGVYVVLDLQPGRSDFLSQAKAYQPLLELPWVGLALDPEWRLKPHEKHLTQIGSVDAAEVNRVITWLADLTSRNALPQKMFVLHQFQLRMIQHRDLVDTSRDELALLIHVDGQGGQPDKQATWNALHVDAPAGVAWGWKNFYDEDHPTLTPKQTMTQVSPPPDLVTYQ
ncbi:hypothetical protein [Cryobacterium tepidiphilum]|nr:hypothetical protein [Cryobacterium tepidiphilum]